MTGTAYERVRLANRLAEEGRPRKSELEIQARLFSGEYGTHWVTTVGRTVEVLHFGHWNREAGPDFKSARLVFDGSAECSGDLELDMDARDWERHGHATNPAYEDVQVQFFVYPSSSGAFARTSRFREVQQVLLSLDGPPSPVSRDLAGAVDRETALAMIEEAAEFRLRSKCAAHARATALHGPETALFHALAAGFGYKNNSIPFLLAAQRTGLRTAMLPDGEARLFGLAGFLAPTEFDAAEPGTKCYLKPLWDAWWAIRDSMARLILPKSAWVFSGIRPSNHPHRRMGALAAMSRRFSALLQVVGCGGRKGIEQFFEDLSHPYWSRHWNLSAARLEGEVALVGPDRVRDLLANAYFPSLPLDKAREESRALAGGTPSGRLLKASQWLVGSVDKALLKTVRQQQGLLQLHADFGSWNALEAWGKIRSR